MEPHRRTGAAAIVAVLLAVGKDRITMFTQYPPDRSLKKNSFRSLKMFGNSIVLVVSRPEVGPPSSVSRCDIDLPSVA